MLNFQDTFYFKIWAQSLLPVEGVWDVTSLSRLAHVCGVETAEGCDYEKKIRRTNPEVPIPSFISIVMALETHMYPQFSYATWAPCLTSNCGDDRGMCRPFRCPTRLRGTLPQRPRRSGRGSRAGSQRPLPVPSAEAVGKVGAAEKQPWSAGHPVHTRHGPGAVPGGLSCRPQSPMLLAQGTY